MKCFVRFVRLNVNIGTKRKTAEYEEWKLYHDCTINHTGSAGSMEAAGVVNIFKRSVETKKLRYTTYLGDGDSKSFKDIVELNIYRATKSRNMYVLDMSKRE